MGNAEKVEILEAVDDGLAVVSPKLEGQAALFDALVAGAVSRVLDEKEAQQAAEAAESEATPESRARSWTVAAANTRDGYSGDWQRFVDWCAERGTAVGIPKELEPLDDDDAIERAAEIEAAFVSASPAAVVKYLLDLDKRGKVISTIGRAAAAVGRTHARYGKSKPTRSERVRDELAYLRKKQKHQPKRAKALELEHFVRIMETVEPRDTLRKLRDAALLSAWFNFGLRRVEIHKARREHVAIEWSEQLREQVLTLLIHESKTDQEAKGKSLAIGVREMESLCALRAVEAWLAATDGLLGDSDPLFPRMRGEKLYPEPVSLRGLDLLIKRVAKQAQLDGSFSTHSVRAGCATTLYSLDVEETQIMKHLRHKDAKTTRIYDRPSNQVTRDPFRKRL